MHFMLDPAEQGPEESPVPAQAEETNPEQEQGKPQCINPCSLYFILNFCFMFHYDYALSL
jgi:hypothetical protein